MLTLLMIVVVNRRRIVIMPQEPPEVTAKRRSPDNAFYTLEEPNSARNRCGRDVRSSAQAGKPAPQRSGFFPE